MLASYMCLDFVIVLIFQNGALNPNSSQAFNIVLQNIFGSKTTFNLHFKKQDKPRGRVRAAFPSAAVFWTLTWRQHRALPGAERETVQLQSQWCN